MGVPATAPAGLTAIWLLRKSSWSGCWNQCSASGAKTASATIPARSNGAEVRRVGGVLRRSHVPLCSCLLLLPLPVPPYLVPPHLRTLTPPYPLYQRHEAQPQRDHRQQPPRRIRVRPQAGCGAERDPGGEAARPPAAPEGPEHQRQQERHQHRLDAHAAEEYRPAHDRQRGRGQEGQRRRQPVVACARAHGPAHRARAPSACRSAPRPRA